MYSALEGADQRYISCMAVDLDPTDWNILGELQADGRLTMAELGRRISMSPSAAAERVRRLESAGVVTGYTAKVDLSAVGLPLVAVVRIRIEGPRHHDLADAVRARPQVLECLRTTGDDCYLLRVAVQDMIELAAVVDDLGRFGATSTSVVYGQTLPLRGPQAPAPAAAG